MRKQRIIIFGGPDRCGKTTIAKALAVRLDIPYFKPSQQRDIAMNAPELFRYQTAFGEPKLQDFLGQTKYSAIMDRGFPCDYAYSKVLKRETEWRTIELLDEFYARMDALLVITLRPSYDELKDDAWSVIDPDMMRALDAAYREYVAKSKMKSLLLVSNVKPEASNLERHVAAIEAALNPLKGQ